MRRQGSRGLLGFPSRFVPVVAFAALSAFASSHWSALVADPPGWRVLAAVVVATAGGVATAALGSRASPGWWAIVARALVALATLAASLVAVGLAPALIWPAGWDELAEGLGRGLTGLRTLEWPYAGPDGWVRLTILLAIPLALSAAAALTFWRPPGGDRVPRMSGLLVLLALYGVAVAQHEVGSPLVQGAMLLALLVAWLFLPRIRRRGALAATAMLLAALLGSLPLAAGLDREDPIIDYSSWHWPGDPTPFDWNHAYGPMDWPRSGETVLTVESSRPHYWKVAALDRFDGLRWVRSETAASPGLDPLVPVAGPPRWSTKVKVTVGTLDSTLLVSPGAAETVQGAPSATPTRDGAGRAEQELEQGAEYTVSAYAPNPSARRMRAAPAPSPFAVRSATLLQLPVPGRTNLDLLGAGDPDSSVPGRPVALPHFIDGLGGTPGAERYVMRSPYARVYKLARRLVAGAPTTYDAVRRVEAHLREEYRYDEQPPDREYPLASFLFEDRSGYCQHFSGAMALILRMDGIPARVATGFAPGERAADSDVFSVRDLDAHSWVEVYFSGLGWVPFDPTPAGAPTASRTDGTLASAARGNEGELQLELAEALAADGAPSPGAAGAPLAGTGGEDGGSPGGGGVPWPAAAIAGAALLGCAALIARARSRGRGGADAPVIELARALERFGHPVTAGTTLMDLERHLRADGRAAAARYVRRIREHRFAHRRRPSDAGARRALRAALTAGTGPLGRIRGYLALPPRRARGV